MERREHTRYGVRAVVDFEWTDEGVLRRGRGLTRDISPKGMFIHSEVKPPAKADLHVEVDFRGATKPNLRLRANALVIRVEQAVSSGLDPGFAILNRSCGLYDGLSDFGDDD